MAEAQRASIETTGAASGITFRRKLQPDAYWGRFRDCGPDRWEARVLPAVLEIAALESGWDGYQAPAISYEACMFALLVLNNTMRAVTPVPQIVPTSSGAIQMEWHERGIDLEIRIAGTYRCEVYFEDHTAAAHEPIELALGADLGPLARIMDELTSR